METSVLKAFAGDARRQLLSEVRARLELVLSEGSTQRREFEPVIAKLESAIGDAGGGEAGRLAVVDRVAYTWFNRIIALRFMDANSYTGIGVVSPAVDRPDGQPEVLVEAKRGDFDADVVAPADVQRITGLLNGSVTSSDPESEAFGLLLAAYCRFWNKSMPFMFEQNPDYTELLMPSDLLSDESVIARAVAVLTPDVCADVEVIGWLYQFYIAERKDEVFTGFKKGKKAGAAEIPAATQLFTPDWIVRYLVENSLGRLWLLNRPDSTLANRMDYYIAPVDEETDFLRIESPAEIKVLDPASGSGHMLTYAFDLLYAMYEEDGYNPADIPTLILSKNLYGTEIDPRAGALAAFALTMKASARQRTFLTKNVTPNICVLEPVAFTPGELTQLISRDGDPEAEVAFFTMFTDADTLGALIQPDEVLLPGIKARAETLDGGGSLFNQDLIQRTRRVVTQAEYLTGRYHVVIANPPYMGTKNMNSAMSLAAESLYPETKTDLFAMFIERNLEFVVPGGQLGFMTPFVWMFISSYAALRKKLLSNTQITSLVQLEYSGFEGATVPVCAFTIADSAAPGRTGAYIRLADFKGAANQGPRALQAIREPGCEWLFWARSSEFQKVPGSPIAYWLGEAMLAMLSRSKELRTLADVRQGLSPADKPRFMRLWWEISYAKIARPGSAAKWCEYNKGGSYRKWFGNVEHVINWADDGAEIKSFKQAAVRNERFYFRQAISWSKVSSGRPSFRFVPAGSIFDGAAGSIFPHDDGLTFALLGLLNSSLVEEALRVYAPTLNFTEGNISSLPMPDTRASEEINLVVQRLTALSRADWDLSETSRDFMGPALEHAQESTIEEVFKSMDRAAAERVSEMSELETRVDLIALRTFAMPVPETQIAVPKAAIAVRRNPFAETGASGLRADDLAAELVSYAVGCMFGRYSLDRPGLILANQGDTVKEYLARVPDAQFMPDEDNVVPLLGDDWFDDDIVERFRLFLRVAFGEEHFEENLRFVEESLGKDIRRYFLMDFYKDHVQRYKKRPIYWMFSSPKSTFNALIYMHRYNPSTVSTVLNEYLREFQAKLEAELNSQGRIASDPSTAGRDKARAEKESDKLRKMIAELKDYEHDVLYPLASQQISIDLDDGVKANYPKFGTALKKIPGLEAARE